MHGFRRRIASFPWFAGLRWSFVGYVAGTLLAAGVAGIILLLAAACFVFSVVCAVLSARRSRIALLYLFLAALMIAVALLFGNGGSIN